MSAFPKKAIKLNHSFTHPIPQLRKSEVKKINKLALEDLYNDSHLLIRLLHIMMINSLRAKLFREKISIYLLFMSLLHIDMAQVPNSVVESYFQ